MGKYFAVVLAAMTVLGFGCYPPPLADGEVREFLIHSSCRGGENGNERYAAAAAGILFLNHQLIGPSA